MKNIKGKIEQVGIPRVIPLVIYTGQAKWIAKKKLEEVQVKFDHLEGIDVITGYNLIDIRSEQEAIADGTAIARMSVIERKNDTEDIIKVVKKMAKYIKSREEKKEFAKEINYLLSDKLTKEEIEKIEEILVEKEGEDAMLHAQMVIRRDFEKAKEEGRREGMLHAQEVIRRDFEKAKEEGRREGMLHVHEIKEKMRKEQLEKLINMAKGLIKENVSIDIVEKITGLKPIATTAKKSIAGFKLRAGNKIGCKVTLRGEKMYTFLDKLISIALPNVRDFRGVSPRSFDGRGNYTLGIKEQLIFPEVNFDDVVKVRGMDIVIVTTAKTNEEAYDLLKELGVPFRK